MNRIVSFAIFGISAAALGACAQAQPGQGQGGQATAQVPVVSDVLRQSPDTRQQRPGVTAAPTTACQSPRAAQHTLRTSDVARDGSLQVQYQGRDDSYRTNPFVYMFQTNATLINRDGSIRDNAGFGLWQGQSQELRMCGRQYAVDLVRVQQNTVTIVLRPR